MGVRGKEGGKELQNFAGFVTASWTLFAFH